MPVFSDVARGLTARARGVESTTLEGTAFTLDLRPVSAEEESNILSRAARLTREAGLEPSVKDLFFQFQYECELVAIAAVDPDSPLDAPRPFFKDAGEVRRGLDRERIVALAEAQYRLQERANPRMTKQLGVDAFFNHVVELAGGEDGDDSPFWALPRSTRESCTRHMARLLFASQMAKSRSGSPSGEPASSS